MPVAGTQWSGQVGPRSAAATTVGVGEALVEQVVELSAQKARLEMAQHAAVARAVAAAEERKQQQMERAQRAEGMYERVQGQVQEQESRGSSDCGTRSWQRATPSS